MSSSSKLALGTCVFGAIALFFLWEEHQAHILGAIPYVLLLLCPLLHLALRRNVRFSAHHLPALGLADAPLSWRRHHVPGHGAPLVGAAGFKGKPHSNPIHILSNVLIEPGRLDLLAGAHEEARVVPRSSRDVKLAWP